jgi:hypothetical protein
MTCASVTIRLRELMYVNLTSQSVTYVSGTFVTLDSGLNNKEGWGEISPLPLESKPGTFIHHPASNPPKPPFVKGGIDLRASLGAQMSSRVPGSTHIAIDPKSAIPVSSVRAIKPCAPSKEKDIALVFPVPCQ